MAEYLSKEELEDYFGREYLTIYDMFGFGPDDYIQHWYRDEIWTRIIGWEEYWISNKGRVWSERNQIMLKHWTGNSHGRYHEGHQYVTLCVKFKRCNVQIHRLLAIHFIPNPNSLQLVGHIDDYRNNNSLPNLEWCTYNKNLDRAYENGCREGLHRPVIAIDTNTGIAKYYISIGRLGDALNMTHLGHINRSIKTGIRVKGHRVYDANEFNLPPELQDGDVIDSEVLYEN